MRNQAADRWGDWPLYRRLLGEVRSCWKHLTGLLLIDLLGSLLVLLTPLPLKIAIDSVLGSHPLPGFLSWTLPSAMSSSSTALLIVAAASLVAIAALTQLQALASSLLRTFTGEKLTLDFRNRLFRHVQRLSLGYHDSQGTADSTYRIQYDAPAVQYLLIDGLLPFLSSVVTLALMLAVTLRLDWQLGLIALAISPILLLVSAVYRRRLREQSREVKKLESSALSVVQEVLSALRVVKAFGQEKREHHRFLNHSHDGMRARMRLLLAEGKYGFLVGVTTAAGTAGVVFIGVRHVQEGLLTLGDLLLMLGYLAQLYDPLRTIGRKVVGVQSHLASLERTYTLLDEAPDVEEKPHARPLARAVGGLAFRDVSFGYEKHRSVLSGVSFSLAPGKRLGIIGATGAGKTTLINLLTRFYDPASGQVLLDGVDVREYRLADLRRQFALVLQESVLFSASIAENIAYARPDASEAEILAAAQAAHAHDFIMRLPSGYETRVGERGMRLSGGERQRIALARAFLKDAPILLMDEPTSSVDLKTEAAILEAMERLMHGRTSVLITHRLHPLSACDSVLVLEQGQLVAQAPEEPSLAS
jgi:ATP-binding cassette subfamily B protein